MQIGCHLYPSGTLNSNAFLLERREWAKATAGAKRLSRRKLNLMVCDEGDFGVQETGMQASHLMSRLVLRPEDPRFGEQALKH